MDKYISFLITSIVIKSYICQIQKLYLLDFIK